MPQRVNDDTFDATISIDGVAEIIAKAQFADLATKKAVQRTLKKYAIKIERDAKRLAPVDTGRLRASIRHRVGNMSAEVLTDVEYAAFQEFGTGRRGSTSGVETPDWYKYGNTPGVKAQPYLRPAVEKNAKSLLRDLRTSIKTSWTSL